MTPSSDQDRRRELLENLTRLIHSSSSSFTSDNTLEKEIWSNEELSCRALQIGLQHAQRDLELALRQQIAALEHEAQKLGRYMQNGRQQLANMQTKDKDEMKGHICEMVHQRWTIEKQTVEMVGEATVENARQEQRRTSRFLELN